MCISTLKVYISMESAHILPTYLKKKKGSTPVTAFVPFFLRVYHVSFLDL